MAKSTSKAAKNVLTMPRPATTTRSASPTSTEIAARAFELYRERGCQQGYDVEDWLRAERELHNTASSTAA